VERTLEGLTRCSCDTNPKDCFKLKKDQDNSKDQDKKLAAKKAAIIVYQAQFAQMKNEDKFDFHNDEVNAENDKMDVNN
jgi:hypothetical protein